MWQAKACELLLNFYFFHFMNFFSPQLHSPAPISFYVCISPDCLILTVSSDGKMLLP